jgi:hypothetical protein
LQFAQGDYRFRVVEFPAREAGIDFVQGNIDELDSFVGFETLCGFFEVKRQKDVIALVREPGRAIARDSMHEASRAIADLFFELAAGAIAGSFARLEAAGGDFEHGFGRGDAVLEHEDDTVNQHRQDPDAAAVVHDFTVCARAVLELDLARAHANYLAIKHRFVVKPGLDHHGVRILGSGFFGGSP